MPNYQGQLAEVRVAFLEAAGVNARFYIGDVDLPEPRLVFPITREGFASTLSLPAEGCKGFLLWCGSRAVIASEASRCNPPS
jgi:hypothetical protein